ncbi:hypothetical protein GQX74_006553 [Glossina fuscipes]|nr:hypothetical protein GQX74_006553 [Glossina fuscipes]
MKMVGLSKWSMGYETDFMKCVQRIHMQYQTCMHCTAFLLCINGVAYYSNVMSFTPGVISFICVNANPQVLLVCLFCVRFLLWLDCFAYLPLECLPKFSILRYYRIQPQLY